MAGRPDMMEELIRDPDAAKAQRVMTAMLGVKKLDVAEIQRAADQG